jgi:hypothetical protein
MPPADAATPTVTIHWDGAKFTSDPTVASGTKVTWVNDASGPLQGSVTIHYVSGPTKFNDVTIATAKSTSVTMTGGSKQATETYTGHESGVAGQNDTGTIVVKAKPTPAPTHTTSSPPKSSKPSSSKPKPTPTPTTAPPVVTNPPPLGIGVLGPTPSPAGPGPLLAGPDPGLSPTPEAAPNANAPRALSQSVPARKYGLPGAIAAVLLTGVAAGVVRLARVEYGNGNGNGNHDPHD